jgi:quercetin dioxygenase-like cupin family protein
MRRGHHNGMTVDRRRWMDERSHLLDITDIPSLDVWGDTVQARVLVGEQASLALVELGPGALVPGHQHVHEQLGLCLTGSITFTIGDETRELGPGGTWRIPSDTPHRAVAGPYGAVVVDIFSPVRADWAALPRSAPRRDRWPAR